MHIQVQVLETEWFNSLDHIWKILGIKEESVTVPIHDLVFKLLYIKLTNNEETNDLYHEYVCVIPNVIEVQ